MAPDIFTYLCLVFLLLLVGSVILKFHYQSTKKLKISLGKGRIVDLYNLADGETALAQLYALYFIDHALSTNDSARCIRTLFEIRYQDFHVEIRGMFKMEPLQGYTVATEWNRLML